MDFAFLKQRYDYELERRDKLTASINLPAGMLTVMAGVLATMIRGFSYEHRGLTCVFLVTVSLAVTAVLVAVYRLLRVYRERIDELLPPLEVLQQDERATKHSTYALGASMKQADGAFADELADHIVRATDWSAEVNYLRTSHMRRATRALAFAILFTTLSGAPYMIEQSKIKQLIYWLTGYHTAYEVPLYDKPNWAGRSPRNIRRHDADPGPRSEAWKEHHAAMLGRRYVRKDIEKDGE